MKPIRDIIVIVVSVLIAFFLGYIQAQQKIANRFRENKKDCYDLVDVYNFIYNENYE